MLLFGVVILRGTIVNRTSDAHKNLYICAFLLTIFGPIYYQNISRSPVDIIGYLVFDLMFRRKLSDGLYYIRWDTHTSTPSLESVRYVSGSIQYTSTDYWYLYARPVRLTWCTCVYNMMLQAACPRGMPWVSSTLQQY